MEIINDLIKYGMAWLQLFEKNLSLFSLEAKLAKFSLLRICLALIILFGLGITGWLSFLFIIGYIIFHYTQSLLVSSVGIFFIITLLLFLLKIYLSSHFKNLRFVHSKSTFRSLMGFTHENKTSEKAD